MMVIACQPEMTATLGPEAALLTHVQFQCAAVYSPYTPASLMHAAGSPGSALPAACADPPLSQTLAGGTSVVAPVISNPMALLSPASWAWALTRASGLGTPELPFAAWTDWVRQCQLHCASGAHILLAVGCHSASDLPRKVYFTAVNGTSQVKLGTSMHRFDQLTPDELSVLSLALATCVQFLGVSLSPDAVSVTATYYTPFTSPTGRKLQVRPSQGK